ncbi:FecCD family ABC transporter permease [Actinomycetota bacterium]
MADRGSGRRPAVTLLALTAGLAVLCLASLALGSRALPLTAVVDGLRGTGDPAVAAVIDSRWPRTVVGLFAGAALGMSGVLAQTATRNPLGDPGLLGATGGAAAAIVTGTAFLGLGSAVWVAIPGALAALGLVMLMGGGRSGLVPVRVILAGAVVTALLGAYVQGVTLTHPRTFDSYRFWAIGSLNNGLPTLGPVLVATLGAALAGALVRPLNALALGDDVAASLGARPGRTRLLALTATALLAAAATAAAGPIVFLGLAAPHVARALVGRDHGLLLPAAALVGPALLLLGDIAGRVVARPEEVQVGVLTALFGGVALLVLVRRGAVAA